MNNKILHTNNINPGNTKFVLSYEQLTDLLQQTVGETILAILAAKTKHLRVTTYDDDLVEATTLTIINDVRNHWNFK